MLVRGDPTLEDSYLRLVWWFSFVLAGIDQLPAVFYSPGHAYYAAFLLFPFSLLSLSPSFSSSPSLSSAWIRTRVQDRRHCTCATTFPKSSRVKFGLISRNSSLLLFFYFFFSTIRVSIFIVGGKFDDYSRVLGRSDSSIAGFIEDDDIEDNPGLRASGHWRFARRSCANAIRTLVITIE